MKKIVCELCEGTQFIKENGMFVCQGCGTKYTIEEARSMMIEVEGDADAQASSSPAVSFINPNKAQIDNILVLATTAYEAQNYAEAENYCNRAIELDAMCYKAWELKGKAVGWQSKIDNLRIEEAAHSFCKAIDFAPEEEKEDLKEQAVQELKKLGLALISLRKNRFSNSPDDDELNGFSSDRRVMLDSLLVLLSHGNICGIPDGYLEEIAVMMNEAAVAAFKKARTVWDKLEHPSDDDLSTYISWISNIENLLRQAIDVCDKDDEKDIVRYENLAIVLEDPIGKHSQKQYWNSYYSEYKWQDSKSLTDSAVSYRRKQAKECKQKAEALKVKVTQDKIAAEEAERKAAEEARRQRIATYWAEHQEEKEKLETERKELEEKKSRISAEIAELNAQIIACQPAEKLPSENEFDTLTAQIDELQTRLSNLGLFAGKEKKQLSQEISTLSEKRNSLQGQVESDRAARQQAVDQKSAPFLQKKGELQSQLVAAINRINAIAAEFEKDPEES